MANRTVTTNKRKPQRIHYKRIKLKDGATRDEHRLVVEANIGRRLKRNEVVHHINGDRLDNRLENLGVLLLSDHSSMHMKKLMGTKEAVKKVRGENNGNSRLKESQIPVIRKMHRSGMSFLEVSKVFSVGEGTIKDIIYRRTWKHVPTSL